MLNNPWNLAFHIMQLIKRRLIFRITLASRSVLIATPIPRLIWDLAVVVPVHCKLDKLQLPQPPPAMQHYWYYPCVCTLLRFVFSILLYPISHCRKINLLLLPHITAAATAAAAVVANGAAAAAGAKSHAYFMGRWYMYFFLLWEIS